MAVLKAKRGAVLAVVAACMLSVQVAEAGRKEELAMEKRIQRLERMLDNRVLIQLLQRLESLQTEVRELRGMVEVQGNEIGAVNKRSRDLYLDTDDRLQALESKRLGALTDGLEANFTESLAAADLEEPSAAALQEEPNALGDIDEERAAYVVAYKDFIGGRYQSATEGFNAFLSVYPSGALADNARYWLGETYYLEGKHKQARHQFETIVSAEASSAKFAEAKLKLGYVMQAQGDLKAAQTELQSVVDEFPGSTAALKAERRLSEIN